MTMTLNALTPSPEGRYRSPDHAALLAVAVLVPVLNLLVPESSPWHLSAPSPSRCSAST
jgi:hypothetical protein